MAMPKHRFERGDHVTLLTRLKTSNAVAGPYQIVQKLPPRDDDNQYRIKSDLERHERVVPESQLSAVPG